MVALLVVVVLRQAFRTVPMCLLLRRLLCADLRVTTHHDHLRWVDLWREPNLSLAVMHCRCVGTQVPRQPLLRQILILHVTLFLNFALIHVEGVLGVFQVDDVIEPLVLAVDRRKPLIAQSIR